VPPGGAVIPVSGERVLIEIDSTVPVVRLAEALACAGLTLRHDRATDRLVIRTARRLPVVAPELAARLNRLAAARGAP